ncbi:metalloregulator ArsR/SmtB family transcription factor [Thalassotalea sp. PS06]|uniref:metalloregulator ArsR/SmtB family transcription factor n=1 Tax=Thalassotalea sp. PS06 TaxID=2594005 RepID=UPI0011646D29|nr:metalloregulator ArsR/SmtB family transcription factor [Thalassotalea sp. PS06]QDP02746.1 winged helix-turn-helix transcriptional regulator [Thalassotalea sp. PS06]
MADVYQALSSSVRRDILALLKMQDLSAGDIAEQLDVGRSTLSGHLNVLKSADLVATQRQGTTIMYSLKTSVVEDVLNQLYSLFAKDTKE